jgi:WD40 repeat protein
MRRLVPIRWITGAVAAAVLVLLSGCGGDSSGPPPLTITAASPPAGTTGVAYPGYTLMASGGVQPLGWSVPGLPTGLTLSTSGQLTGTPETAGSYPIMFTVVDSSQPAQTAQVPVTLVINDSKIVIATTPAPPSGTVTYPYPVFYFSASGGSQPYTWQATGTVPPGLALGSDGSLSGTPTQVGTFAFTVTAKDSVPTPASSSYLFTITITPTPPPTIANSEAPTGMVGVVYAPFQFSTSGGLAPFVWMETGAVDGLALSSSGVLSGTPSAAGKFPITLEVTDALKRTAPSVPLIVRVSLARSGTFTLTTGSLTVARSRHTATLLNTGKVLVAGGAQGAADPSAELYDPKTEMFTATGSMTEARAGHTATLLNVSAVANFGKVLIVGSPDSTAELYDPAAGTFAATGSMTQARTSPTATLLETGSAKLGSVLIVGGNVAGDLTAELYNPATGTFSATGSTSILRAGHTATQLLDGRVLIAGGGTNTAELYDPTSGTFTPTGSMRVVRTGATATRLQDGTVLIFGADGSADLYDANTGSFAPVGSNPLVANGPTASLRHDGSVLTAGGISFGRFGLTVSAAALFAPESDGFTATGSLNTSRDSHTATVLADGAVLIVGGTEITRSYYGGIYRQILSSAELFK